jgi:hypothetical protein
MNTGEYWESMGQAHDGEPITEGLYFGDVIKLMAEEMKTGKDNGKMILSLLRAGAKDYLKNCIDDADIPDLESELEKVLDDRERARDVSRTLRETAASVFTDY